MSSQENTTASVPSAAPTPPPALLEMSGVDDSMEVEGSREARMRWVCVLPACSCCLPWLPVALADVSPLGQDRFGGSAIATQHLPSAALPCLLCLILLVVDAC